MSDSAGFMSKWIFQTSHLSPHPQSSAETKRNMPRALAAFSVPPQPKRPKPLCSAPKRLGFDSKTGGRQYPRTFWFEGLPELKLIRKRFRTEFAHTRIPGTMENKPRPYWYRRDEPIARAWPKDRASVGTTADGSPHNHPPEKAPCRRPESRVCPASNANSSFSAALT